MLKPLSHPETMPFNILEPIRHTRTIAVGARIRELGRLQAHYGRGRWRKRKGNALVSLADGTIRLAELHWYEATGIGRREIKIKRFLD